MALICVPHRPSGRFYFFSDALALARDPSLVARRTQDKVVHHIDNAEAMWRPASGCANIRQPPGRAAPDTVKSPSSPVPTGRLFDAARDAHWTNPRIDYAALDARWTGALWRFARVLRDQPSRTARKKTSSPWTTSFTPSGVLRDETLGHQARVPRSCQSLSAPARRHR